MKIEIRNHKQIWEKFYAIFPRECDDGEWRRGWLWKSTRFNFLNEPLNYLDCYTENVYKPLKQHCDWT